MEVHFEVASDEELARHDCGGNGGALGGCCVLLVSSILSCCNSMAGYGSCVVKKSKARKVLEGQFQRSVGHFEQLQARRHSADSRKSEGEREMQWQRL